MDGLIFVSGLLGSLLLFDVLAVLFGVDTRESIPDDHVRG
jgi:hypothetical protein